MVFAGTYSKKYPQDDYSLAGWGNYSTKQHGTNLKPFLFQLFGHLMNLMKRHIFCQIQFNLIGIQIKAKSLNVFGLVA